MPALCRDLLLAGMGPAISEADEMMQFFYHAEGRLREKAATLYFESGRHIWRTLRQALLWRFGSQASAWSSTCRPARIRTTPGSRCWPSPPQAKSCA